MKRSSRRLLKSNLSINSNQYFFAYVNINLN